MNFHGVNKYDDFDYFEFVWKYERLVEFRKQQNEAENNEGQMSLANLDSNIFGKMGNNK
tara:strand:- start:4261 stop:4437 length:177 start_codon:yes stop_codon:yes gene_type:complete